MNNLGQVTELNMGTSSTDGSLMKLQFEYGEFDQYGNVDLTKNAGNIARQTINFNGLANPFVQEYKYDALDRISEAKETVNSTQTWIQEFGYDRYGNRTSHAETINGQHKPINEVTLPTIEAATNRFANQTYYQYDAVGNLITDVHGRQFIFNGDNKHIEVKNSSNVTIGEYKYDGNGKRIKKETATEYVVFVYDGFGKLIGEYSAEGPPVNPIVSFTAADPLGSPRVLTDENGTIVSRRDFMPFGEEVIADGTHRTTALKYGVGDNVRQKFTGYERDEETGLDFAEARYYYNNHGRFTAVDPLLASGKSADPQTFNRYAYVMNRPFVYTDPTGLQAGDTSGDQKSRNLYIFLTLSQQNMTTSLGDSPPSFNGLVEQGKKNGVNVILIDSGYGEGLSTENTKKGMFKQALQDSDALGVLFIGHGSGEFTETSFNASGIDLTGTQGYLSSDELGEVENVAANFVGIFSCDGASVARSVKGSGSVIGVDSGDNGETSLYAIGATGHAAAKALIDGGDAKTVLEASKNALNEAQKLKLKYKHKDEEIDKGDKIIQLK